MNRFHRWYCRTSHWEETVQQRVPWVLSNTALGDHVLEVGPGPGLTTDRLQHSARRLTALELHAGLAQSLRARLHGSNVDVVTGDATAMPFGAAAFSACVSFAMLHHVPSRELQDQLLREVHRVIRPGGYFLGSDTRDSLLMRLIHLGDQFMPVDPDTFETRLTAAGFQVVETETNDRAFRFCARRGM